MVLIALEREKVLRLPLRSYRLSNRISQFRFDIVFIGTERGVPKLKPTEFEVDVKFSPPRVIAVPGDFQSVRVQAVA